MRVWACECKLRHELSIQATRWLVWSGREHCGKTFAMMVCNNSVLKSMARNMRLLLLLYRWSLHRTICTFNLLVISSLSYQFLCYNRQISTKNLIWQYRDFYPSNASKTSYWTLTLTSPLQQTNVVMTGFITSLFLCRRNTKGFFARKSLEKNIDDYAPQWYSAVPRFEEKILAGRLIWLKYKSWHFATKIRFACRYVA